VNLQQIEPMTLSRVAAAFDDADFLFGNYMREKGLSFHLRLDYV
jgi:hypothetical protein